jgi:D-3-phosphoglycerate dehydrogenase / 2-oxoglutarate reductase
MISEDIKAKTLHFTMADKKNILLLESVSKEAYQLLDNSGKLLVAESPFSGEKWAEENDIHAIITRGLGKVDAALIEKCSGLEVIARCGVGLDNIDVRFAKSRNIEVVNAPGSNAATVAEHTLALLLMLQRNMFHAAAAVRDGNWDFRKTYQGDEIRAKTIGIIGMGDIGQKVASLATSFGMKVIYHNKSEKNLPYPSFSLDDLLAQCDVLSLHLPLTEETRKILNKKKIEKLKKGALIINTSRGEVIEQVALRDALIQGHLGGFAADVLEKEPPLTGDPLITMQNVLITPHSASLTALTFNEMCVITVKKALNILNN